MPTEYNYFEVDEFTWDLLKAYLKHGYGMFKMYDITAFHASLNDEIAVMTVAEYASKVEKMDGTKWCESEEVCQMCPNCPQNCPDQLVKEFLDN